MLIAVLLIVGVLILSELVAVGLLYRSVGSHKRFWQTEAQKPGEYTYVALGDSAAQGVGALNPQNGYVGLLGKQLREKTGKTVRTVNLSESGARIQDVLQNQIPQLKRLKPDLVTIEIGANDIASFDRKKFEEQFTILVNLLPDGTYVSNMPYFGSRASRRQNAFEASRIIEKILRNQNRLVLVDLQSITEERDSLRNYAADYFHPNSRAYKNWAEAFWLAIEPRLKL